MHCYTIDNYVIQLSLYVNREANWRECLDLHIPVGQLKIFKQLTLIRNTGPQQIASIANIELIKKIGVALSFDMAPTKPPAPRTPARRKETTSNTTPRKSASKRIVSAKSTPAKTTPAKTTPAKISRTKQFRSTPNKNPPNKVDKHDNVMTLASSSTPSHVINSGKPSPGKIAQQKWNALADE